MNLPLLRKIQAAIRRMREVWKKTEGKIRFVAFSTGKDSLAMTAMLYEAVEPERPVCLYSHHHLEFPIYLEYLEEIRKKGFHVEVVHPFLEYFELMERGMGFVTLADAWCVPMLVGTAMIGWLQEQGARSPRSGIMFRGMSGSEYSRKYHTEIELYRRLDLPCYNPLLGFTKEEILEIVQARYGLPLNPIYEHMDRSYCICCYTSDARRQTYSSKHFPAVCRKYYRQIEKMLFDSGLIERSHLEPEFKTRDEKIRQHGFIYWRRSRMQDVVGAIKRRLSVNVVAYQIRDPQWISTKHLCPLKGRWARVGNEIRFWDTPATVTDTLIKRMINCLDCGFCVMTCFPCRKFDRASKTLQIEGCIQCGKCLHLKFCMGWKHRFWRRVIVETDSYGPPDGQPKQLPLLRNGMPSVP